MRILVVEDHKKINDLLALFAKQDGHEVLQTYNAEDALDLLANQAFDIVITDLMLPGMQGEMLIQNIRNTSDIYIIVISAKTDIDNKLDVLSIGADDYITKPFSVDEVMMKLKNISKRQVLMRPSVQSYNQKCLVIKPLLREVYYNNKLISLTKYEYDVLFYLVNHPNKVFNRNELMTACFTDSDAYDRVIDAYIKNIRKKLNDNPSNPQFIKTFYGIGYQFIGDSDD